MKGFNFEKNLSHQSHAVESTIAVFENLEKHSVTEVDKNYINPVYNKIQSQGDVIENNISPQLQYYNNIRAVQNNNQIIENIKIKSNIIDIMMETGTGKTYTYTKTIFELNKNFGIFKFIVVVPTLSIKAGTIDFLKSDSSREHFKEQYGKTIHLHIVESQKNNKSKKSFIPPAVISFVNAGSFEKNSIQVMIINAGMINSDTMEKSFDKGLFDKYTIPFDALAAIKPFMIIDEPHKFGLNSATWKNILKMGPQFVMRYGATFQSYENLIYTLSAVDAFNNNLVKGIIGHITEFNAVQNTLVELVDIDNTEAIFRLRENNIDNLFRLRESDSFAIVHNQMTQLILEKISGRANNRVVLLSNGKELRRGESISPYSYSISLQEIMIQKAIKNHFEIEKQLLTREVKIKPLTLFFIDNIQEYRDQNGYIRNILEQYIRAEVENLINTEVDPFYKEYLEKTLRDLSATHAGYFSKDNTEKDEAIEKEINEILHDKQSMLSLENPRRFIFSKWTLREGWDNPNVFQICKLRSSGSEISKLQEVGRGLRLPVNEYGNRVKDEQFYLNYFVDFTESDFVDKLVNEINQKSGAVSIETTHTNVTPLVKVILEKYPKQFSDEVQLLEFLDNKKVINRNNDFKEGGLDFIKSNFPLIFEGVNSTKVRKATDDKKKIDVKTEKYQELKELWEKLNEKVILEYKFENEDKFKEIFVNYLKTENNQFELCGINEIIQKIKIKDGTAVQEESIPLNGNKKTSIAIMRYSEFLKELARVINVNLYTIHSAFNESNTKINEYLNPSTIRIIKQNFENYLMAKAFADFQIEYQKVSNNIHPTKLTDEKGKVLEEISASDVGVLFSEESVADSYFFEKLYYDSDLEKSNIKAKIDQVTVFTKIPKNSIKIPVAGGKTYSPDFAYVVKYNNSEKKLHFIVETKNVVNENELRSEEIFKIKHAEKFFGNTVKIEFKTQFSNNRIEDLINEIYKKV